MVLQAEDLEKGVISWFPKLPGNQKLSPRIYHLNIFAFPGKHLGKALWLVSDRAQFQHWLCHLLVVESLANVNVLQAQCPHL